MELLLKSYAVALIILIPGYDKYGDGLNLFPFIPAKANGASCSSFSIHKSTSFMNSNIVYATSLDVLMSA